MSNKNKIKDVPKFDKLREKMKEKIPKSKKPIERQ